MFDSVIVLCFIVPYFVSILVLKSSRWGREEGVDRRGRGYRDKVDGIGVVGAESGVEGAGSGGRGGRERG